MSRANFVYKGDMALEANWKLIAAALGAAAITIAATIYATRPAPSPDAPVAAAQTKHDEPARFGPGILSAAPQSDAPPAAPPQADPWVPEGVDVTPDQHLVINKEMRSVFDYFLQPANPGDRAERLEKLNAYLKAKLPATAYDEATPIVSKYVEYLAAFDAQNLGDKDAPPTAPGDAQRLEIKMNELSRLRQSTLGVSLAQLWFGDEEVGMQQMLARRGKTPRIAIPDNVR